jgi:hypothetical protein
VVVKLVAMLNTSSWAVAAVAEITAAAVVVAAVSARALGWPVSRHPIRSPLEAAVLPAIPHAVYKAGHPSSVPSPVRAAAAAEAGMDQKEPAGTAVAVVAAVELMLLKRAGPDHTATTAARMLEAKATKVVLAAAEQVKLAQLGLLAV